MARVRKASFCTSQLILRTIIMTRGFITLNEAPRISLGGVLDHIGRPRHVYDHCSLGTAANLNKEAVVRKGVGLDIVVVKLFRF